MACRDLKDQPDLYSLEDNELLVLDKQLYIPGAPSSTGLC